METLINGELVLIDLDAVWGETFVLWDALVPTDVAMQIATATENIVRAAAAAR